MQNVILQIDILHIKKQAHRPQIVFPFNQIPNICLRIRGCLYFTQKILKNSFQITKNSSWKCNVRVIANVINFEPLILIGSRIARGSILQVRIARRFGKGRFGSLEDRYRGGSSNPTLKLLQILETFKLQKIFETLNK